MSAVKSDLLNVVLEKSWKSTFSKMDSRMSKMSNIIIRGLPEVKGTVEERVRGDEETAVKLLRFLDVTSVRPVAVRRVGKTLKGKPRLLRATLSDPAGRQEVLKQDS